MDMTRYEKITGREALKRLADGEKVIRETGSSYFVCSEGRFVCDNVVLGGPRVTDLTLDEILNECDWYIKKPFDVRQAMRDKPDEWVAAFKTSENDWVKVGFDTSEFTVVGLELSNDAPLNAAHDYFKVCVYGTDLDACIPLDEVPADAR